MGIATRTNLARNAVPSSDSEWKDPEGFWNLAYLIDGYVTDSWPLASGRTLGWRSGICDGRDTEINIILDLEDVQTFDEMALYPRGNGGICFPEDYSVLISDDGNDWECIYTKTGDSETSEKKRTLKFECVSARYVRLQITKLSEEKDGADFLCEISEIEIWGECETKMKLNKSNLQMSIGAEDKLSPESKG